MKETFTFDRVDRLTDILYGVAAAGGVIEYVPLGRRVHQRPDRLGHALGQVSRRSVADGGPMWTALCVSAVAGRPNEQFCELARELRPEYSTQDDEEVWDQESERCYAAASSSGPDAPPTQPDDDYESVEDFLLGS